MKFKVGEWYKGDDWHHEKAMFDGIYSYCKATIVEGNNIVLDVYDFIQSLEPISTIEYNNPMIYRLRRSSEAEVNESIAWIAGRLLVGRVRF